MLESSVVVRKLPILGQQCYSTCSCILHSTVRNTQIHVYYTSTCIVYPCMYTDTYSIHAFEGCIVYCKSVKYACTYAIFPLGRNRQFFTTERLFSAGSLVRTPLRNKLGDKRFEMLLLLKYSFHLN